MRLGIDFGTTHTVVSLCDRGNYPVVSFSDDDGLTQDNYPSVLAERDGEFLFGLDALRCQDDPSWHFVRSFKRLLNVPNDRITIGSSQVPPSDLVAGFLNTLVQDLKNRSSFPANGVIDEVILATPAEAHSRQRFWMLAGARAAGLKVISVLSEPTAAAIEYADRHTRTINSVRQRFLVFDLGGGTFDVSLMQVTDKFHELVAHAGLNDLGGDDLDQVLCDLVLQQAEVEKEGLSHFELNALRLNCRAQKENIHPNTRKIAVEFRGSVHMIAISDYYEACTPLLEPAIQLSREIAGDQNQLAGVYVVGGASALPLVGRLLRHEFSKRVRRTNYPSASIAIGLAIAFDPDQKVEVKDIETQNFGVFRELENGEDIGFDPLFDLRFPTQPGLGMKQERIREYRAAHNIGHYRFVRCASLRSDGSPHGELFPAGEFYFPFDDQLQEGSSSLRELPIERLESQGPLIREHYELDVSGRLKLNILALESGFRQSYEFDAI